MTKNDSVLLKIQVKTNCKRQMLILDSESSFLLVHLKSTPEKGKANSELIKFLAKIVEKASSEVIIIQGLTSRDKIVLIKNATLELILDSIKKYNYEK